MIDLVRFLVPLFSPFSISMVFLLVAVGFLFAKRRKKATICLCLGVGLLLFSGYGLITNGMLYRLERAYPPFSFERLDPETRARLHYVVVLGSGHISNPALPVTAQIGADSLYRLVEGIRIFRQLPGSKLVISGGRIPDPVPNAHVVTAVARHIGVDPDKMIMEDRPRDTFEEAQFLRMILGDEPFVLVTSAAHMKRAIEVFRSFKMKPLPAPTNFVFKNKMTFLNGAWLPTCGNLEISRRVFYEWLGRLWGTLKKRFAKSHNSKPHPKSANITLHG